MGQQEKVLWHLPSSSRIDVSELAATIAQRRGLHFNEYFDLKYTALGDPFTLPDMEAAVDHLMEVHRRRAKVVIYGDYDIDGLTAVTLLMDALAQLGFDVASYIPDRFEEGYGLHTRALKKLHAQGIDTVITVDCGISSGVAIQEAAADGLHIIVTDHHTIPEVEPVGAVALINPLRRNNQYGERQLAGVGVAFALVRALQARNLGGMPLGQEKWLLDLVALGTICDVVPLVGENRILAQYGLRVAQQSRRPGFRALARVSNVDLAKVSAGDFGFKFGPRLNAAGRLEHAKIALELLESITSDAAYKAADHLDELNQVRRLKTEKIQEEALVVAQTYASDPILVLSNSDWSHGVAGLVASRVAERMGKPTIILQEEGEYSKGSARSIGDFSIIDALHSQASLLDRYGGHQAAAGMTLRTDRIKDLRKRLNEKISPKQLLQMQREVRVDLYLQEDFISLAGLEQLEKLEPTGQANPSPIFYILTTLEQVKLVGKNGEHSQLFFVVDSSSQRAIAFQAVHKWPFLQSGVEVELLVAIRANEWQGVRRAQLEVLDARVYQDAN